METFDAYIGPGYAKAGPEIFETIVLLARTEGAVVCKEPATSFLFIPVVFLVCFHNGTVLISCQGKAKCITRMANGYAM